MEDYHKIQLDPKAYERTVKTEDVLDLLKKARGRSDQGGLTAEQLVQKHQQEKIRKASRRKWAGRGLIAFGSALILGSCPLYALSLIGPYSIAAGLVLIAGGSALMAWKPKLRDTNEALLIAAVHGNFLTAPRLALELDISLAKADSIIQELVRTGIAEIDLDQNDPDKPIVYKIRGL